METVQEVSLIGSPRGPEDSILEKMDDASRFQPRLQTAWTPAPECTRGQGKGEGDSETDNVKGSRRGGAASAPLLTKQAVSNT